MNYDMTGMMSGLERRLTVNEFCRTFNVSRTKFYELVKQGHLHPRKCGRRTLIATEEANRWWNSLPTM